MHSFSFQSPPWVPSLLAQGAGHKDTQAHNHDPRTHTSHTHGAGQSVNMRRGQLLSILGAWHTSLYPPPPSCTFSPFREVGRASSSVTASSWPSCVHGVRAEVASWPRTSSVPARCRSECCSEPAPAGGGACCPGPGARAGALAHAGCCSHPGPGARAVCQCWDRMDTAPILSFRFGP